MDATEASGSLAIGPPVSTAARAPYRRHTLFGTTVSEAPAAAQRRPNSMPQASGQPARFPSAAAAAGAGTGLALAHAMTMASVVTATGMTADRRIMHPGELQ